MKNKTVEKQLKLCSYANLNNYDEATNTFYIPKYTKPKYDIGKCYLVKVSKEIINNPTTLLASNWNHGTSPKYEYLKIYVSKIIGKMLNVDAIYFDANVNQDIPGETWSGFLSVDDLTQISII